MTELRNLTTKVSIDGLGLSCYNNFSKNVFVGSPLGGYKKVRDINLVAQQLRNHSGVIDRRGLNYKWLLQFEHQATSNVLNIYTQKIQNQHLVPSVFAFFHSSYHNPLGSLDVKFALKDLCGKKLKGFNLSQVHLATDLIAPEEINLHQRVCRSMNPLRKRQIVVFEGSPDTLYLGSPRSPNQVVAYDKGVELNEKHGILIEEDVSRIETRMRASLKGNSIETLEDLRREGWASFIYGRFFSLDRPRHALKALIGERGAKMPIYKIKDTMRKQNGKLPDNFHRDYIREHRIFGPAVRNALASYKWN